MNARMVLLLAGWSLTAMGCGDGDGDGNGNGGDGATDDTDLTDPYGGCHPLIAEYLLELGKDPLDASENGLCFELITTTPCTTRRGGEGTRVYRFLEDGRADADGNFSGTERWFWFSGNRETWDEDAVDTISYSGQTSVRFNGEQLNCVQCDEIYEATRTIVENQTGTPYATDVVFALNNINVNGGFEGGPEERNMLVFYGRYNRDGEIRDLDTDYAKGQYTPDDMEPGSLPASYTWGPLGAEGRCY